jgi:hypothetical protein
MKCGGMSDWYLPNEQNGISEDTIILIFSAVGTLNLNFMYTLVFKQCSFTLFSGIYIFLYNRAR